MTTRPLPTEYTRHPTWELVEMFAESPITAKVIQANTLVPSEYDYIALSYTGTNLTSVTFKSGGSGGTTVATLTLAYSGTQLSSVTKS